MFKPGVSVLQHLSEQRLLMGLGDAVWGCSSVVERILCMYEVLGSISRFYANKILS